MSILIKLVRIDGDKGGEEVDALFDTGTTYSFISKSIAKKVATVLLLPHPKVFELAEKGRKLEAKERISLDITLNGFTVSDDIIVVDNLSESLIIGAGTMQKWRIKLDMENDKVVIDERAVRLRLI
ncbi:MAG: retropepsin-like aspartic protease [bacterium]|nr:retropepsin-like aspartic protease [bacterium]